MHGWYQTSLPWKGNHPTLPTNKMGSKKRLENDLYEEYNSIIEEQLLQGIVEAAPGAGVPTENEYYIPHKAVVKKEAETTKLRIVYSPRADPPREE
jgi:hypothetical protein